jgi:hypothetical protein
MTMTTMHQLTKERRYLLNSILNREFRRRERDHHHKRIQLENTTTGVSGATALHIPTGKVTTMSFYSSGANPFYHYWTMDKDKAQWFPEKFNKNIGLPEFVRSYYTNAVVANPDFVDIRTFSTDFIDAIDELYYIMQQARCITDREFEGTFKRVFSASYNIGRFYFDWEKTHFGVTKVCNKWHELVLNE